LIIVRLNGGLGNQLFQYSAAYALALKNNDCLKIDISGYLSPSLQNQTYRNFDLVDFLITAEVARPDEIAKIKNPLPFFSNLNRLIRQKIFRAYYIDWHPKIFNLKGDIYLDGYFQSEKYFLECLDKLRNELSLKPDLYQKIESIAQRIHVNPNSVSLHIRRGDFVENPKASRYHHVCDISYYNDAIASMQKKIPELHLYIFSDDPDWVRNNLPLTIPTTFVSNGKGMANTLRPSQELVLMSKCHHHILSNSSYSWWGAYLNSSSTKIVLAPNIWNKGPIPQPNILPERWVSLSVYRNE
jgi:hypothetical protein